MIQYEIYSAACTGSMGMGESWVESIEASYDTLAETIIDLNRRFPKQGYINFTWVRQVEFTNRRNLKVLKTWQIYKDQHNKIILKDV